MNRNENLSALNRAFDKAFAHTASRETLADLLSCLGEELSCDRISIFEINPDGTCDNTYEWCQESMLSEKDLLQHLPVSWLGHWKERLLRDEIIVIHDMEEIRATDEDIYMVFREQQVHSVIVSKLAFHGSSRGFFILENPGVPVLEEAEEILPGMRYILSSLVYSDHLIRRLEQIGYVDSLTGAGNRLSLQEKLESTDAGDGVGMIYCDVIGWLVEDGKPQHLEHEQMLLHASSILETLFEYNEVFRVSTGEFLVMVCQVEEELFLEKADIVKRLFQEQDLMAACGIQWTEHLTDTYEAMIRRTHLLMYNDKRVLLKEHENNVWGKKELWEYQENAQIALYHGDVFFKKAELWLSTLMDENVLTSVIDINYFKLYNDIFGRKAGNLFLESIAESLSSFAREFRGIAGYLGGDNFCLMLPTKEDAPEKLVPFLKERIGTMKYTDGFAPLFGIYLSVDQQESVSTRYDRALTALGEIKGSYTEQFRFYSEEHYQDIRENKLLLMNVKKGLPKGEFLFYLQPQVHERTGKIIGAEALMRWNRDGEIVSPGRFVEMLEKSGYIFAVDCYIWEDVCRWMRSLLDRNMPLLLCSVNVSRVDFYFTDIADHFISLVNKYDLDPYYLGIEITESAFTDNNDVIQKAVTRLHEAGFRILMDDFGSGSSSLSMLHSMNLDVLKTDVRFMSRKESDSKAISIVESVISMAHMIGMLVVTEGVETEHQRDSLIQLGDNYAQGFYFYEPMPVEEFERLLLDENKIGKPPVRGGRIMTNHLRFREMIHEGMLSDTLLDNIIGPAMIFKEKKNQLSLIQVNNSFTKVTGIHPEDLHAMQNFMDAFSEEEQEKLWEVFMKAHDHPLEGSEGIISGNHLMMEKPGNMRLRIFLLYSCDDHKLYMGTLQE